MFIRTVKQASKAEDINFRRFHLVFLNKLLCALMARRVMYCAL